MVSNLCRMHSALLTGLLLLHTSFARETSVDKTESEGAVTHDSKVVCYYRWLHRGLEPNQLHLLRRPLTGQDKAEVPERAACSHIILAFATIGDDFTANLSSVGGIGGVSRFVSEGRPEQSTKMMLSIGGGGSHGRRNFEKLVANKTAVKIFQESLQQVVVSTGLDGVDFDWEFPGILQANQFGRFLERTKRTLNAIEEDRRANMTEDSTVQSSQQTQNSMELSVALPGPFTLSAGYSPEHLRDNCTFVNVMTYDLVLYERWHPVAAQHNALYGQNGLFGLLKPFSVEYSMENWVDMGIPRHMLMLGIPTYGVAYELVDAEHTHHIAAVKGYSKLGANINFDKVCRIRAENPDYVRYDETSRVPYVHDGKGNWISYDDERSVAEKAAFGAGHGYGGIMVFSLNADDPFGECPRITSELEHSSDAPVESNSTTETLSDILREPFPLTRIAAHTLREGIRKRSK